MKLTKAEWDAFQKDDSHWSDGMCIDDTLFLVNGGEVDDISPDLPESTPISILNGVVTDDELKPIRSLVAHVRRWRKAQQVRQVAIEVPVDLDDKALRAHLKAIGGKIATTC